MSTQTTGRLYLIPNVLGDTAPLEVIPMSAKKNIEELRHFVFEKEKAGRVFVKRIAPTVPQDKIAVFLLNKFFMRLTKLVQLNILCLLLILHPL